METIENFWDLYKILDRDLFIDKERTQSEVRAILNFLSLNKGAAVLDLGCGSGRVAKSLTDYGFKVTGIDFDLEEIEKARKKTGKKAHFIHGSYYAIDFINEFDAVLSVYSSFGYDSDQESLNLLKKISQALKNDGILLLDLLSKEWAINTARTKDMSNKVNLSRYEITSIIRERKITKDDKYEQTNFILTNKDNKQKILTHQQRLFTIVEIESLLNKAGLKIINTMGDFSGTAFNANESKRLIIIAKKLIS